MHEFVVTLRNGTRFTVKADHIALHDDRFVALGTDGPHGATVVAVFARGEVAVVTSRAHLLGEEKGDPISPHYVGGDSDIPF